ncbi:hypothetical protein PybrP1_006654 [[Pythium] brassicae (nom. inval.)]|nr:hypothetical protein PybrP1_006654 [[Pythium] brassicae (nom. inval.)]
MRPLPPLGSRGWRLLDDLAFECEVVAVDSDSATIRVRYEDDNRVEEGVGLLEFRSLSEEAQALDTNNNQSKQQELPAHIDGVTCHSGIRSAATEFVLLRRPLWRCVRAPRELDTVRFASLRGLLTELEVAAETAEPESADDSGRLVIQRARVAETVEELVLSGTAVTDKQVLELVRCCTGGTLSRVTLRGCSRVSFLLLYELTRLAKLTRCEGDEQRAATREVDVWLCRGVSPAYVTQLRGHGAFERAGMRVRGPGFAVMEVSAATWQWIERESSSEPPCYQGGAAVGAGDAARASICLKNLTVRFVPRASFSALFGDQLPTGGDSANSSSSVARELTGVRDHLDTLSLASIPLVRVDRVLSCSADASSPRSGLYALVGVPTAPEDLLQLVREYEETHLASELCSVLRRLTPPAPKVHPEQREADSEGDAEESELSLDARADKVFAKLRRSRTELEAHVARLERQVQQMTLARNEAQRQVLDAQRELDRVAKEGDRALLSLATSSAAPPPPPQPLGGSALLQVVGDDRLPPLPSDEQLQALGAALQRDAVALLDDFIGRELSASVRADIEQLYTASRLEHGRGGPQSTAATVANSFQLGELAGGSTGRNLRYKMQHVRGDHVLWLDELDAFCPLSVRRVLRQLDRLVLERLPGFNAELRDSSLLRKKAMATCYPGTGARYTKHCDNPNNNGRKLTAILYLNADWAPRHGGELQLHVPPRRRDELYSQLSGGGDDSGLVTTVAPLMDRLLLFFSDRRVPHEVLPCLERDRFALTVWYLDYDEFMSAQVFGPMLQDQRDEERRIQREIQGFIAANDDGSPPPLPQPTTATMQL